VSIYAVYGCKLPANVNDLRRLAVSKVKEGILGIKLKDQSFNNHHRAYSSFLREFENGQHIMDKDWILLEAMARAIFRPIILLSSLPEHENKKVGKEDELSITLPLTGGSGSARVWGHVKFLFIVQGRKFYSFSLKAPVSSES
jgi:hypothetical protein